MDDKQPHIPVLLNEVLQIIEPKDNEIYVDGTFGAGGYTDALLRASHCHVLGIDQDPNAVRDGQYLVKTYGGRLTLVQGRFSAMERIAKDNGIEKVDAVALDLGVSSMQLDQSERGFSFRHDGPLDMRMSQSGQSVADIVNEMPEKTLAEIIETYGEEKKARAIAKAIVKHRTQKPITRTSELADIIRSVVRRSKKDDIDPATRTFQALRIYANDEMNELKAGLEAAERLLKPGGKLVVVTFHSLEDRMVKEFFRIRCGYGVSVSRHAPPANTNTPPSFKMINKKPVTSGDEELKRNPRARSAKLRAAKRTDEPAWENVS